MNLARRTVLDPFSSIALSAGVLLGRRKERGTLHPDALVLPWLKIEPGFFGPEKYRCAAKTSSHHGQLMVSRARAGAHEATLWGPAWYADLVASVLDGTYLGRRVGWRKDYCDPRYDYSAVSFGTNYERVRLISFDPTVAMRIVEDLHLLAVSRMDGERAEFFMKTLSDEARARMDWLVEQMER